MDNDAPIEEIADRVIWRDEVKELIRALLAKGVDRGMLFEAVLDGVTIKDVAAFGMKKENEL